MVHYSFVYSHEQEMSRVIEVVNVRFQKSTCMSPSPSFASCRLTGNFWRCRPHIADAQPRLYKELDIFVFLEFHNIHSPHLEIMSAFTEANRKAFE